MAHAKGEPVPDPLKGTKALDEHLPLVLQGRTLQDAGWFRPNKLTLLVPMFGTLEDGTGDFYLLSLGFGCYPDWPPSAQFVNPRTLTYKFPDDLEWLPRIEGTSEIAVHENYQSIQLICSSVTLEFYQVKHDVKEEHVWNFTRQNFSATLNAIKFGLRPAFYKGPKKQRT